MYIIYFAIIKNKEKEISLGVKPEIAFFGNIPLSVQILHSI